MGKFVKGDIVIIPYRTTWGCPKRIFSAEVCCPLDSLEFHGGKR
jgi:hypothetical protein